MKEEFNSQQTKTKHDGKLGARAYSLDEDKTADTSFKRKGREKEYNKEYYKNNKDKYKEARKKQLEKNEDYDKEYYQKQKDKNSYKKSHRKATNKFDKNNPEQKKARMMAQNKIKIEGICQECKINPAKHRHHDDYSKPLQVRLLCNKCHRKIHNG